jgi:predicted metal-dependent hydrolase
MDTADEAIHALLSDKQQWFSDKLRISREAAARPAVLGLDEPGVVHLAGAVVPVSRRSDREPGAALREDVLIVGGTKQQALLAIERWYRRRAATAAKRLVAQHSQRLGVSAKSVAIRDAATRWGSCSTLGNLSFSWRLVMAPPNVLEYVVIHELCHLIQPNHSRWFWRLLDSVHPEWRSAAGWLKEHGQELHDYRPRLAKTPS